MASLWTQNWVLSCTWPAIPSINEAHPPPTLWCITRQWSFGQALESFSIRCLTCCVFTFDITLLLMKKLARSMPSNYTLRSLTKTNKPNQTDCFYIPVFKIYLMLLKIMSHRSETYLHQIMKEMYQHCTYLICSCSLRWCSLQSSCTLPSGTL